MILPLTQPHDVKKPEDFDFKNPIKDPKELADELWENMKHYNGLGLSANQIGINTRVFVMGHEQHDFRMNVFNPRVVEIADEMKAYKEGCLTWPFLMLSIRRPIDCVVNYWNEEGEPKLEKLQDMTARIFLHEYDHMNGIDFTQRASRLALNIGMKKRDKILKRLEREGKLKKGEDGLYEVSPTSK